MNYNGKQVVAVNAHLGLLNSLKGAFSLHPNADKAKRAQRLIDRERDKVKRLARAA